MTWSKVDPLWRPAPRSRAIHRYEVPVDDTWHSVVMTGEILHVAARELEVVEVWAFAGDYSPVTLELRAFGTGQPIPSGYGGVPLRHVGTALVRNSGLVWHVLQRMAGLGKADPR